MAIIFPFPISKARVRAMSSVNLADSSVGKKSACNAGDPGLIPGSRRSPGGGKGYPLQCSGLENSMDSPWGRKESDTTEPLSLSPGGRGLASMVSKLETTAYPALLFPSKTKLLPSVYQISSGSEDLLAIPLMVLSSGPRFLGKSERGESPQGYAGGWQG